jgi:hypothetical protein
MTMTRKDVIATGLVALVVVAFFAAHQSWGIPLIGESYRWASVAAFVLGGGAYLASEPLEGYHEPVLGVLGIVALGLGILALATGSLTFLSLFVADIVVLWAATTLGHMRHRAHRSISA